MTNLRQMTTIDKWQREMTNLRQMTKTNGKFKIETNDKIMNGIFETNGKFETKFWDKWQILRQMTNFKTNDKFKTKTNDKWQREMTNLRQIKKTNDKFLWQRQMVLRQIWDKFETIHTCSKIFF